MNDVLKQFRGICPVLGLIPAFSNSAEDLIEFAGKLKETGCILVTANNCGTVKAGLRNNECCKIERTNGDNRCRDVRSFISVPREHYTLRDGHSGKTIKKNHSGVFIGRAPCDGGREDDNPVCNHNTVFSWVIPCEATEPEL